MISFSSNVQSALTGPSSAAFYLMKFGDVYKTSYFRDLTIGGISYISDGSIVHIEPPQLTSTVDRQPFKITIADTMFEYGPVSEQGLLGTPVEIRIGFEDPSTKQPFLSEGDTLLVYKGKIDGTGYTVNTAQYGSSVFVVTCTTPMSDLDLTRAYYVTQDHLDKNYAEDTAYEQLFEGSGQINIKWGRA